MVIGLLVPVALMAVFNRRLHFSATICAKTSAVILTGLFVWWPSRRGLGTGTGVMTGVWLRVASSEGEKGEEKVEPLV